MIATTTSNEKATAVVLELKALHEGLRPFTERVVDYFEGRISHIELWTPFQDTPFERLASPRFDRGILAVPELRKGDMEALLQLINDLKALLSEGGEKA